MDIIFDSREHQNELTLCGNRKDGKYSFFLGSHCYKVFDLKYETQFNKERGILEALRGVPGICSIEKSGLALIDNREMLCIQMPYYGSRDVLKELSETRCLNEDKLLPIIKTIIAPFLELEKKGYRHNDLAHANLLAYNKRFVLIDFGSAIKLDDIQNGTYESQSIEGHIDYIAPEKKDHRILPESDIYSFGILLEEIMNKGISKGANYTEQLVQVAVKCKEAVASERYHSFQEIMDAINNLRHKDDTPIHIDELEEKGKIRISSSRAVHVQHRPILRNGLIALTLFLSFFILAEETYMAFRHYSDDPKEQDALYHPSVKKDIQIIKNDFQKLIDHVKNI